MHEHIYWDQASALAQLGLIDASTPPVAGAESAEKMIDPIHLGIERRHRRPALRLRRAIVWLCLAEIRENKVLNNQSACSPQRNRLNNSTTLSKETDF